MADDQRVREAKVLETVGEWLPELTRDPGLTIQITAADPDDPETPEGALFSLSKTRVFACRRGSGL